jgi:hypothetical protein
MFGCSTNRDLDAKVVNNALVVSFLTADPPRVWRADMTGLSTATLELREGQPGRFRLVMRTGNGKEEDISTFADKQTATDALRVVTNAMLRGEGGSAGGSPSYYAAPSSGSSLGGTALKIVVWFGAVLVAIWLVLHALSGGGHAGRELPAGVKPGAAVPADKIFGGK